MSLSGVENKTIQVYWANLCILNRMENEKMEESGKLWRQSKSLVPEIVYLGDTEEIKMYEKMDADMAEGRLGFDLLVSTRFDLFTSKKYLQSQKESLMPLKKHFELRSEVKDWNLCDPEGLFLPLVTLPHFIVVNSEVIPENRAPHSLEDLLDPGWKDLIYVGAADLPSAKSVLMAMWYLFGSEGLEICVKNWHQKSAPSAARHGLVKGEFPIALLPGIFAGPGPGDKLMRIWPREGAPLLPSYAAIKASPLQEETLDFLKNSVVRRDFIEFYRNQAFAYPAISGIDIPENLNSDGKMLFPDWNWIQNQDWEYFEDVCRRIQTK